MNLRQTTMFGLPAEDQRSPGPPVMVTLRVSEAEREGLKMRAKDANCSLNVYVRRMLNLSDKTYR